MVWRKIVILITILFFIGGCANQRYGRNVKVTESEKDNLSCQNIEMELEKSQEFVNGVVNKDNEFTGRDVLAFLGDFGIGNSMETSDAIKSGTNRIKELNELKTTKKCRDTNQEVTGTNE